MIPHPGPFDQATLAALRAADPLVQRYRALFALLDWTVLPERSTDHPWPGSPPHPRQAYVKALLVKLCEHQEYCTHLHTFLLDHPLLVLELGFRPVPDPTAPYGFDVARTVPGARWLRAQQQHLDPVLLDGLFAATVTALRAEIPELGTTVAIDVKHIYAWVCQNNPKAYVADRYDPAHQPSGDPDCRLGVKRSTNQIQPDGTLRERKEYVWGYGTGVVSAWHPQYGDCVLAHHTQPFNEADVTYYRPLHTQVSTVLERPPTNLAADAAFDAWYVYQDAAQAGGVAAVPLNTHGQPEPVRTRTGQPICSLGRPMTASYEFAHPNGYRAQVFRCPLLHPQRTGEGCHHEQFTKGVGCVKYINIEVGGQQRVVLDRTGAAYRAIYRQRTSAERINSQAKAWGIERPKVRNGRSVHTLNSLTYVVINLHALQRVRARKVHTQIAELVLC